MGSQGRFEQFKLNLESEESREQLEAEYKAHVGQPFNESDLPKGVSAIDHLKAIPLQDKGVEISRLIAIHREQDREEKMNRNSHWQD